MEMNDSSICCHQDQLINEGSWSLLPFVCVFGGWKFRFGISYNRNNENQFHPGFQQTTKFCLQFCLIPRKWGFSGIYQMNRQVNGMVFSWPSYPFLQLLVIEKNGAIATVVYYRISIQVSDNRIYMFTFSSSHQPLWWTVLFSPRRRRCPKALIRMCSRASEWVLEIENQEIMLSW